MKTIPPSSLSAAVAPVSALQLLHQEGERRKRVRGRTTTCNVHLDDDNNNSTTVSNSIPLLCLAQNPFFHLPLGITELAGAAGAGKTQLVVSLCADCVTTFNKRNKAVYISLGGSSRFLQTVAKRLQGMLQSRVTASNKNSDDKKQYQAQEAIHHSMNRIFLLWIRNSDELMELLHSSLPRLLKLHPTVSLVVLDGIANLFRIHEEDYQPGPTHHGIYQNQWQHRAAVFFQISRLCRALSSTFQVPFVVVNGATCRITNDASDKIETKDLSATNMAVTEPALGLAWFQCVNCRFFVTRGQKLQQQQQESAVATEDTSPTVGRVTSGDDDERCDTPLNHYLVQNSYREQPQRMLIPPNNIIRRRLQCLKAPHISSNRSILDFWVDKRGVHPIQVKKL